MTLTVDAVFAAALSLPNETRIALAEELVKSLERDDVAALSPAWAAEIRKRIDAYKRGEMKVIPAEDVVGSLTDGDGS